MKHKRVAWLLPSAFFYWHPFLAEFAKLYPLTKVFTASWYGFANGYNEAFQVKVVGSRRVVPIIKSSTGYGYNITYVPLNIISELLFFKPNIIFANSFGIWTAIAISLKLLTNWKVIIAYEGSSPSVDFCDSPHRLFLRKIFIKLADGCITNSYAGRNYLINILGINIEKVVKVPYEVPSLHSLTSGKNSNLEALKYLNKPCFIYVGSLIPRKGLYYLLEACNVLVNTGETKFSLVIIGEGSQREELENYCAKYNLTSYVQWIGRVEYTQLSSFFELADVFVFPTLEDTWGMVVLEAMLMGKAVLCSKFAGASELIMEGENGYTFDPQNIKEIVNLMRGFVDNPSFSRLMGKKAHETISRYTPEKAALACSDFLESNH